MLFGQHLRRRDEHRLQSRSDGLHHRGNGDHRLAGAHFALEQSLHRIIARHVGGDVGDDLSLPGGQVERQGCDEIIQQCGFGAGRSSRLARGVA